MGAQPRLGSLVRIPLVHVTDRGSNCIGDFGAFGRAVGSRSRSREQCEPAHLAAITRTLWTRADSGRLVLPLVMLDNEVLLGIARPVRGRSTGTTPHSQLEGIFEVAVFDPEPCEPGGTVGPAGSRRTTPATLRACPRSAHTHRRHTDLARRDPDPTGSHSRHRSGVLLARLFPGHRRHRSRNRVERHRSTSSEGPLYYSPSSAVRRPTVQGVRGAHSFLVPRQTSGSRPDHIPHTVSHGKPAGPIEHHR